MKKVNFKKALMAFMVAFTFLVLGMGTANAQDAIVDNPYIPVQGSFVNGDQATVLLTDAVNGLETLLQTLSQGSPLYNSTLAQALYYRGIIMDIQATNQVPESIVTGLGYLNDGSGFGDLDNSTLLSLKQDAITLLSD